MLPALPASMACVLIAHQPLPRADLPAHTIYRGADDLRLGDRSACELADRVGADLATSAIHRAVAITEGRAVALAGLFAASATLGSAALGQIMARASNRDDLLAQVARACMATAGPDDRQALAIALQVEYSHPELIQASLRGGVIPAGPWLQPLADGWQRVRLAWQAPLRAALRTWPPQRTPLRRAAGYLAQQGATERAIALALAIGDTAAAAEMIAEGLGMMMDLGQWEMLAGWLSQLPAHELHAWPWLVYARGELALAQGDTSGAGDAFALATSLFTAKQDAEGTCQSLLAESSLAPGHGDSGHAQERARTALAIAESASLARYQSWAAWHLGRLSTNTGDVDAALSFYERATNTADIAGDRAMAELLRAAGQHARRQRDLHRQREFYRHAYFAAERAEHEAAEALCQNFAASRDQVAALLGVHGWLHTPLAHKQPAPAIPAKPSPTAHMGLWRRLLDRLGIGPGTLQAAASSPSSSAWPLLGIPMSPTSAGDSLPSSTMALLAPASDPSTGASLDRAPSDGRSFERAALGLDAGLPIMEAVAVPDDQQADATEAAPLWTLTIHLLGPFQVVLNDHPVQNWPSGRGRVLFYLPAHASRAAGPARRAYGHLLAQRRSRGRPQ